jgi:biopolymer transport protein ExbD
MERLEPIIEARGDETVFLKGDRELPYGNIIEVLDILNRGGIRQVGMVTERPD